MFQNISQDTEAIENKEKINLLSNVFDKSNLILYIVSFMLSMVGVDGEFSIFSISILGACFSSSVPALGVLVLSLIGNLIKYGVRRSTWILSNRSNVINYNVYCKATL